MVDDGTGDERQAAISRLQNKQSFWTNLVSYFVVCGMLVVVWALTGAGYFWPVWVMAGWGIGLLLHAWTAFFQKPISEADIQREMRRDA